MAQDQVLERKVLAGTTAINWDAKHHQEEAQHRRRSISGQGAPRCVHDPDRLLPPFNPTVSSLNGRVKIDRL